MVSRFLESIPPELLEEKSTASLWAPRRTSGGWLAPWEVTTVPRATPTRLYAIDEDVQNQDAPRLVKGERVRHRRFSPHLWTVDPGRRLLSYLLLAVIILTM